MREITIAILATILSMLVLFQGFDLLVKRVASQVGTEMQAPPYQIDKGG